MSSRTRLLAAGLGLALLCVAIGSAAGVIEGWLAARALIAENDYAALGFGRGAHVLVRDATRGGLDTGLRLGLAFGTYALALSAGVAALGTERLLRGLRDRSKLGWIALGVTTAACAGLIALGRQRAWDGPRGVAYAFALAAACSAMLWWIARGLRAADEARARAAAGAAALALGVCAPVAFLAGRGIALGAADAASYAKLGASLAALLAAFLVLRRWLHAAQSGARDRLAPALWVALLLAAGGVAFALHGPGAGPAAPTRTAGRPHNVILIGLDTVRADATSIYGPSFSGRDSTPRLRALAERGARFDDAVSQAPWTLPSFASMLTGKYPLEHGAFLLRGRLRLAETTLAEVLREAGYQTFGVTSHLYVNAYQGFGQGFDWFDSSNSRGHDAITSRAITDLAIDALSKRDERPFFLFAHYFDAHYEFRNHKGWDWGDGYTGWLRRQNDFENILKLRHLLEQPEIDWLVALYQEEIAYLDAQVGRLLDWIDAQGLRDDTLVIVVSDHGEEFFERENFGHTISLYQEQLHVPLILAGAGVEPQQVESLVETRAIYGTVLDALDLDYDEPARADSLLRVAAAEREAGAALERPPAFSMVWLIDSPLEMGKRVQASALRDGRWKLVEDVTRERFLLYDLESDPGETRNLVDSRPEVFERLKPTLRQWTRTQASQGKGTRGLPIDPETARQLRALGYF